MSMEIIDIAAKKYRVILCPHCKSDAIEISSITKDDWENDVTEYECRNCDNIFELDEEYQSYDEESLDAEEWNDLDENRRCMIPD